ncbi:MAG: pitrilysin family protein [Thermoanaerobaculia bacterium]
MKKIILSLFLILFSITIFSQEKRPFENFVYPKLESIKIPPVTKITLPNGLKVMLVEDHKLPLVKGNMIFKAGSVFDPPEKAGLSSIFFEVWRLGGTKTKTGDEIDEFLESRSAYIEAYGGEESGYLTFNCLTENFQEVFPLFMEILTSPAFREDKLELSKAQAKSNISRRNDEPQSIVFREFSRIFYGKDHPYARIQEYDTVDAISQKDLFDFHQRYVFPENAILALWGDIKVKEIEGLLKKYFKDWKSKGQKVPEFPKLPEKITPGVYFSDKEDINQGYIVMGHYGIQMNNPDYFPLLIANRIFGHGFSSRLFQSIRTDKGLTYGIYGGVDADYSHKGQATIYTFTKSETVVDAIKAIIEEVKLLKAEGVKEEELERERKSYLNEFVFNFDTIDKIIRRLQTYEFYGYPEDFILKTKENVEKLKKEDLDRVVKKYWMPEEFIVYIVGNQKGIGERLKELGEIKYWDITIPKPKGEKAPEATEETLSKGFEILKKAYLQAGGEKIDELKIIKLEGKLTTSVPQGNFTMDFTSVNYFPDKFRMDLKTPMGLMVQVLNGDIAWMKMGDSYQDLPSSKIKEDLQRGYFYILKQYKEKKADFQYLKEENGIDILLVKGLGEDFEVGIDKEGKLNFLRYTGPTQAGFGKIEEKFSDFKDIEGIKYPFRVEAVVDGKLFQTIEISSASLLKEIDLKIFEKQ